MVLKKLYVQYETEAKFLSLDKLLFEKNKWSTSSKKF